MFLLAPTHQQAGNFIRDCWLCYCIVWTVTMFGTKRTVEQWDFTSRTIYFFAWVVTLLLLCGTVPWDRPRLFGHGPVASILACVACAAGLVVTIWARFALGRNWSGDVAVKQQHELVERGPYRLIRHPIYTGLLLMLLGWAMVRGTLAGLLGVAVFLGVHIWKLRLEEALMRRTFPEAYPAYCARTNALLPGVF